MSDLRAGICAFVGPNGETCGHPYSAHKVFSNPCGLCVMCDHPVTFESPGASYHYFVGPRLAGGTFDPDAERKAYEEAMQAKGQS